MTKEKKKEKKRMLRNIFGFIRDFSIKDALSIYGINFERVYLRSNPITDQTSYDQIKETNKKIFETYQTINDYVNKDCRISYEAIIIGTCTDCFELGQRRSTIATKLVLALDFLSGIGTALIFLPELGFKIIGIISIVLAIIIATFI